MIHANIDNFGFDLIVTCQNVNGCPAIEKILGHLRGDRFGIGADPFFGDTMVSSEDEYELGSETRWNCLLDDRHTTCKLLQPAQAAPRLCQCIELALRRRIE